MTAAVRDRLAQLLGEQLGESPARIYPHGIAGVLELPAIVFGQPDVEFGEWGCTDKNVLGIAVVVRDEPTGPIDTIRALDDLWPQVAGALKRVCTDPTLGGLVDHADLATADFGSFTVAGRTFPAQNITINIYT